MLGFKVIQVEPMRFMMLESLSRSYGTISLVPDTSVDLVIARSFEL
jgi:hypothetical protein